MIYKDFVLGFLVASLLTSSFFTYCPYGRKLIVSPSGASKQEVECQVVIKIVLDKDSKLQNSELPGSFILDDPKDE